MAVTMGALVRFKEVTGKDASRIDSGDITEVATLLWCCVVSACKRAGIDFEMSFIEFADRLTPQDMEHFVTAMNDEKKTTQ